MWMQMCMWMWLYTMHTYVLVIWILNGVGEECEIYDGHAVYT